MEQEYNSVDFPGEWGLTFLAFLPPAPQESLGDWQTIREVICETLGLYV